jgi:hypothetical protein
VAGGLGRGAEVLVGVLGAGDEELRQVRAAGWMGGAAEEFRFKAGVLVWWRGE